MGHTMGAAGWITFGLPAHWLEFIKKTGDQINKMLCFFIFFLNCLTLHENFKKIWNFTY